MALDYKEKEFTNSKIDENCSAGLYIQKGKGAYQIN